MRSPLKFTLFLLTCVFVLLFVLFIGCNKSKKLSEEVKPMVKIETSLGDVTVELDPEKAPITTENFLKYVENNYYDSLVFHRVIPDFMIQGGGFNSDMQEKLQKYPPIKNEAGNGLANQIGTIAMARTQVVDSATSQFFINTADNVFLNHRDETPQGFGYAVFGKIISGMDVVRKIEQVPTTTSDYHENVPMEPVIIKSVRRI